MANVQVFDPAMCCSTGVCSARLFFSLARTKHELDRTSVERGADSDGEDVSKIARALGVKTGEVEEMTIRLSGRDLSLDEEACRGCC